MLKNFIRALVLGLYQSEFLELVTVEVDLLFYSHPSLYHGLFIVASLYCGVFKNVFLKPVMQ